MFKKLILAMVVAAILSLPMTAFAAEWIRTSSHVPSETVNESMAS